MLDIFRFLFNEKTNIYVQDIGNPVIDFIFIAITNIGNYPVYFIIASLIFWCYNKKMGIRIMYVLFFSAYVAILAKNLFGLPRPPQLINKIYENGFGFPSGHSLVSSGFWGYLGFYLKKPRFIIAGVIAILSVSFSRVYLGVHYVGDVIGGILFGLIIAYLALKAGPEFGNKIQYLDRKQKYTAAFLIPVLLAVIPVSKSGLLEEQVGIALVMAGVGIGYLLEEEHIMLGEVKSNRQRFKRACVGTGILGVVYLLSWLLMFLIPNISLLKFAALGFTSTFVVPWVLNRMDSFQGDSGFA